jgi:predicted nucleic acid-binding protein
MDTSALLAVVLNEPERAAVIAATRGAQLLAAPSLPWEVGNALIALRRRRKIEVEEIPRAWATFERIPLRLLEIDVPAALDLAQTHTLYAYDAYVLQAARAARAPLVTLDRKVLRVARAEGIQIKEVAS